MLETRHYDDARRANREKQRRFRERHKAELQAERQQRALRRLSRLPGRPQRWRLYERTVPQCASADVLLLRDGEPVPSGYGPSLWLPSIPIGRRLAETLAAGRRRQIREWFAGSGNLQTPS
jgi:hypothetical protein